MLRDAINPSEPTALDAPNALGGLTPSARRRLAPFARLGNASDNHSVNSRDKTRWAMSFSMVQDRSSISV